MRAFDLTRIVRNIWSAFHELDVASRRKWERKGCRWVAVVAKGKIHIPLSAHNSHQSRVRPTHVYIHPIIVHPNQDYTDANWRSAQFIDKRPIDLRVGRRDERKKVEGYKGGADSPKVMRALGCFFASSMTALSSIFNSLRSSLVTGPASRKQVTARGEGNEGVKCEATVAGTSKGAVCDGADRSDIGDSDGR